MAKAIAQTYTFSREHGMEVAAALLIVCGFLAALYGFNVYAVISHTVALEKLEIQAATINTAVGKLDVQYIELSAKITPDALASYGLKPGAVTDYISRSPDFGEVASLGR